MRYILKPFETKSPFSHFLQLSVELSRPSTNSLCFVFNLEDLSLGVESDPRGVIDALILGEIKQPSLRERKDELWRSSCLELFISAPGLSQYLEMNLSPRGDWNLYGFEKTRMGMHPVANALPPLVDLSRANSFCMSWRGEVTVESPSSGLASGQAGQQSIFDQVMTTGSLVIGATAVLQYKGGEIEYWALSHCGDKPDFHLRDSFIVQLN
jgi:hypothetical protein